MSKTDMDRLIIQCSEGKRAVVGDGATIVYGSDQYPATVIEVSRTGHRIKIQYDTVRRVDKNGFSEDQKWEINPNSAGEIRVATRRRNGAYRIKGEPTRVLIGFRRMYRDPSF